MPSQEAGAKPRRPCATPAAPIAVRLPRRRGEQLVGGTVAITGRKKRRLSRRELRRGRVFVRKLPAGTTARVRIRVRVRSRGRVRTVTVERTLRAVCG
jgi:hypothetical protein